MILYNSPERANFELGPSVFLAGTIEMGNSKNWQKDLIEKLKEFECVIYNPRRDDWNNAWQKTDIEVRQIEWEVYHILQADIVAFNFLPGTFSPISLFELGLMAKERRKQIIVHCPDNFYRASNVDVYSKLFNFTKVNSEEELFTAITLALMCTKNNKDEFKSEVFPRNPARGNQSIN